MRLRTQFLLSAFAADQFPSETRTGGAPEIAFLGRSNVGKSSLINALLSETAARVSSTPGRTRSINFFALHEQLPGGQQRPLPALVFADLPGYGYAKISKSISAEWPSFIDPYLADRPQLALGCCLVDTNVPPQKSDRQLMDFLRSVRRQFVVVGTKSDRLSKNAIAKSVALLKREHGVDEVIACSAKLGKQDPGLKELWKRLLATREIGAPHLTEDTHIEGISMMKSTPNETQAPPAVDADRRRDTNLAPQGEMHPDAPPESAFTPEGDQEASPKIPPSATDPA